MANITLQIRVGTSEADKMGREYKFSVCDVNTKVEHRKILDLAEDGALKAIEEHYGQVKAGLVEFKEDWGKINKENEERGIQTKSGFSYRWPPWRKSERR